MNFLEEIEPYNKRLDTFEKLKTCSGTDRNDLRALADIFLKYVSSPKGDMVPTLGCRACMNKMFQRIVTHRNQERKKNVDFINTCINAGSKIHIKTLNKQIDLEEQIAEEEGKVLVEVREQMNQFYTTEGLKDNPVLSDEDKQAHEDERVKSLPWGKFKKYCNKQGLNIKGKRKAELLKELGL